MQLTTRGRYAVMALVELAARAADAPCGPVTVAEIAASQQISPAYLEQIFGRLRKAGLVDSARGPGGGYRLGRPSREITVAAILAAVDEPIRITRCEGTTPGCLVGTGERRMQCRTHDLWEATGRHLLLFLAAVTLADVLSGDVCVVAARTAVAEPAEALL